MSAGTYIGVGFGSGMGLLLIVLATIYAIKTLKDRKTEKMREYFFKQNRGLLLQQLVDKDIAERMIFSLEELDKATNKFDEARILGGGGHGTVYKGILSNQHVVAIKKSKLVIQKEIDGFINEVAILSQINHRNVVRLFGCCLETEVPLLVYEFISNGTLYAHLHVDAHVSLPWKDRLRIASEVASSLAYLHSEASISIVHRDIKTSNILLDDNLTAKVSDFGASRGISINKSGVTASIQGTYGHLDPEYFYTRRLTEKSDVYSYGVMLIELLTRKKPAIDISVEGVSLVEHFIQLFCEDRLSEILDVQVTEEGEEEAKQVAAAAALCLQMKGDDRPTMRHGETILHRIQSSNDNYQDDPGVQAGMELRNTTFEGINNVGVHDNNSRRLVWREKCCCRQAFLGEPVLGVKMTICKNKMCTINASI
jgi:serine/threonine protein kinase